MDRVAAALQRDRVVAGDTIAICGGDAASTTRDFSRRGADRRRGRAAAAVRDAGEPRGDARRLRRAALVRRRHHARPVRRPRRSALDDGFVDWLAPEGARPTPVEIDPTPVFNTIYSSGTTGAPKGIDQSHAMRFVHTRRRLLSGYDADAVTLVSTPLYSNTTLVSVFPRWPAAAASS